MLLSAWRGGLSRKRPSTGSPRHEVGVSLQCPVDESGSPACSCEGCESRTSGVASASEWFQHASRRPHLELALAHRCAGQHVASFATWALRQPSAGEVACHLHTNTPQHGPQTVTASNAGAREHKRGPATPIAGRSAARSGRGAEGATGCAGPGEQCHICATCARTPPLVDTRKPDHTDMTSTSQTNAFRPFSLEIEASARTA